MTAAQLPQHQEARQLRTAPSRGGRSSVPLLTIFVLAVVHFPDQQLHRRGRVQPVRRGRGPLGRVDRAASSSRCWVSNRPTSSPARAATRTRHPRAVIGSIVIGLFIYIPLQIVFIAALPAIDRGTWADGAASLASPGRSRRSRRCPALAGWPRSSTPTRSSPRRHGSDLHHGQLAGLLRLSRNGYFPSSSSGPTSAGCRGSG